MKLPAHGKINLGLEVLGRRPDGFHEIVTVLQRLELHDELRFAPDDCLSLDCSDSSLSGSDNLILRAARLLKEATGCTKGAAIQLEKAIPVSAGLGGGSCDAAAALCGLVQLWGLSIGEGMLFDLAAQLGSDVPFFLDGPTAQAEGRGERLHHLPPLAPHWVVLVVPRVFIPEKTRTLYGALAASDFTDGARTRALTRELEAGREPEGDLLVNTFERLVVRRYPLVEECRQAMLQNGARWVQLSGAGPALFTLSAEQGEAQALCEGLCAVLPAETAQVILTRTA